MLFLHLNLLVNLQSNIFMIKIKVTVFQFSFRRPNLFIHRIIINFTRFYYRIYLDKEVKEIIHKITTTKNYIKI